MGAKVRDGLAVRGHPSRSTPSTGLRVRRPRPRGWIHDRGQEWRGVRWGLRYRSFFFVRKKRTAKDGSNTKSTNGSNVRKNSDRVPKSARNPIHESPRT